MKIDPSTTKLRGATGMCEVNFGVPNFFLRKILREKHLLENVGKLLPKFLPSEISPQRASIVGVEMNDFLTEC